VVCLGCAALLGLGLIGTAEAAIPASERTVLLNLYNSTNGANWTNKTGWNGAVGTECSWFGVVCDGAQSHVIQVWLAGSNLTGSLPWLSGLTALQSFDVSFNRLTGAIPSISGLTALQGFYVSSNQLTGAIPSLNGLTALQYFYVDDNQLTGSIPSLSGLTALQGFLAFKNQQLTGPIPSLSGLTALRNFWVNGTQLTGAIPSLSGLTALETFNVGSNQLTGAIPSLSGLTALQIFDVGGNQLTGAIPSLSGLSALQSFWVNSNQLTGSILSLSGLTALRYFVASNNQLTGAIPAAPSSLLAGQSGLCNNQLQSSGNAAIDAAWTTATGTNWLACQTVTNTAPTANPVTLSGTAQVGQSLSGSYSYADADSDPENISASGSTYRFIRDIGIDFSPIPPPGVGSGGLASGRTNGSTQTYVVQAADIGFYLAYCVTPAASSGSTPGYENCSAGTAMVTAAPVALPVCQLTASPTTISAGSSATLQASCSPAVTTYQWSGACASVTGATCTVAPTVTTTYSVTGSNATGSSTPASATVTVTEPPLSPPLCALTASTSSIPPGGSTTLSASCSPAVSSYTWTGGTCAGQTGPTCTVSPTETTSYSITGSNAAGTRGPVYTTVRVIATSSVLPYTNNGDGTVTDPRTGLTWMRCALGQTWTGSSCSGTASTYTWTQAVALTGTLNIAGKSDWRLPNVRELQSIIDRSTYSPAIHVGAFPNTPSNGFFWSASTYTYSTDYRTSRWYVNFDNGVTTYSQSGNFHVRLVRSGQSLGILNLARPTADYFDHGDGTTTHTPSGLMWKRCAEGLSWSGSTCTGSANRYNGADVQGLSSVFAGKNDWRLPSEEELISLVDYTIDNNYSSAINTTLFPLSPWDWFWSASFYKPDSARVWGVDFGESFSDANDTINGRGYARLVRSGQSLGTFPLTLSATGSGYGTLSSSPGSLNCTSTAGSSSGTCAANLAAGSTVTLTATPASGSTFAGWSGACTGTGQCVVTLAAVTSVSARFNPVPFVVSTHLQLTPTSASLDTRITFNSGDIGKTGAVFVTARVPASALATLPMAPSSKIAAELTASADPSSMVTIQLTAAGWSIIENGQLLPYASGVLGDLLAAQKILDSADPRLMPGAQFCLGYGASALEMLNNDRLQLIATIPDGGTVFSGSCLDVDSRGQAIEFYHSALKHYFITIDPNEAAAIDAGAAGAGWTRTGGTFKVYPTQASGSQPVCRFYGSQNPGPNSHFFTVSADECAGLQAQQASTPETVKKWHYENIAFYIFTPINAGCTGGSTPVYRYYNNGFAHGEDSNHRLTGDATQRASMEAAGWGYEGVVMCAP
jgi:hypothetical protein